jgi:hypothetical protein
MIFPIYKIRPTESLIEVAIAPKKYKIQKQKGTGHRMYLHLSHRIEDEIYFKFDLNY